MDPRWRALALERASSGLESSRERREYPAASRARCHDGVMNCRALSPHELVAFAIHREDVPRIRRIGLELLPQPQNVVVDGPGRWIVLVAPHLVQQAIARDDPAAIGSEQPQHIELLAGEVDTP